MRIVIGLSICGCSGRVGCLVGTIYWQWLCGGGVVLVLFEAGYRLLPTWAFVVLSVFIRLIMGAICVRSIGRGLGLVIGLLLVLSLLLGSCNVAASACCVWEMERGIKPTGFGSYIGIENSRHVQIAKSTTLWRNNCLRSSKLASGRHHRTLRASRGSELPHTFLPPQV